MFKKFFEYFFSKKDVHLEVVITEDESNNDACRGKIFVDYYTTSDGLKYSVYVSNKTKYTVEDLWKLWMLFKGKKVPANCGYYVANPYELLYLNTNLLEFFDINGEFDKLDTLDQLGNYAYSVKVFEESLKHDCNPEVGPFRYNQQTVIGEEVSPRHCNNGTFTLSRDVVPGTLKVAVYLNSLHVSDVQFSQLLNEKLQVSIKHCELKNETYDFEPSVAKVVGGMMLKNSFILLWDNLQSTDEVRCLATYDYFVEAELVRT